MSFLLHPQGICETERVGRGTRIWAFAHVLPGASIGADCNICDHVFVENEVVIGDRVTIKSGVQVWDGVTLEDDVFVGPNATFTNDRFPRSKQYLDEPKDTVVEAGASVGANATILPGIRIGRSAMVGAGAVVTHSVPANAIVSGNPARITGYVGTSETRIEAELTASERPSPDQVGPPKRVPLGIGEAALYEMPVFRDLRGSLTVGTFGEVVPFVVQRYFLVYDVPGAHVRGAHGHRACAQFLICVSGSTTVLVDDGERRTEVVLDRPSLGLYLPAMTWSVQYKHSTDATVLVFASEKYDPGDYIRSYEEFQQLIQAKRSVGQS